MFFGLRSLRSDFDDWRISLKRLWQAWGRQIQPWLHTEDPRQVSLYDASAQFLLVVACIWYFVAYLCNDSVPSNVADGPPAWWGWHDQGEYYKSTIALAHGEIKPNPYWFGYPLLGVPLYWLMPRHPYFVPDIIMVLIMVGTFFGACRHFMGRLEAWVLVIFAFFAERVLRDGCLIPPWNTLPAYAAIYLSAYWLLFTRPTLWHFALCAVFGGEALFSRPTEIFPIAAIYLLALLSLEGGARKLWAAAYFGIVCAAVVAITLWLNLHLYGQFTSPYMSGEGPKFSAANLGLKFYQLFCDGNFLTGNAGLGTDTTTFSILERYPIFLFLLPGAIYLLRACGAKMLGLFLAIVSSVVFYLTYATCANAPYFWTYSSFHYIWWIIPWLILLSYLTFRRALFAFPRGLFLATLITPLLLFLAAGFKAVPVAVSTADLTKNELQLATSTTGQTYTVNLISPAEINAMDLRLEFQNPPSYPGTSVDSAPKVNVSVNGVIQRSMPDYFMSQAGNTFDFSFLVHGLSLKQGDHIRVEFNDTREPVLARASLLEIVFAPGQARTP